MPYVKSLTLNGDTVSGAVLSHQQLVEGGELRFEMSPVREVWG